MRDIIMWNLISLDGCFEGEKKWDLDFHEHVWGDELEQISLGYLRAADGILFGRVTYEGMAAHWPTARGAIAELMNAIPKIVFSRTLERADWNNTRLVRGSAEEEVARLREQPGKPLMVIGSAELCSSLIVRGLIDELRICIVPTVLGAGTPLFKPRVGRQRLELVDVRQLKTGGTINRYRRAAPSD
jgi:dihydrofolate reductase